MERWLLNPVYKYCYWNPFSVEACDLYLTYMVSWAPFLFSISDGCPWQVGQLSSVLHLAREPTVHFPNVDMVSHLLFCWSWCLEFAFSELTLQGRVASYIDWGCLDTLPLWLFCAVYAEPWPGSWFGLLGFSLFYQVLYFDKKGDQAKIVFLSLCWQRERLLSLTRPSCKNTNGRLPCPWWFNPK